MLEFLTGSQLSDDCRDETALVLAAQNGDQQAFRLLATKYRNVLMWYARRCSPDRSYIDDYVQEGLCGLLKAVRTYDGVSSSFSTYASLCIRTSIISAVRKYRRLGDRLVSYEETVSESEGLIGSSPETIIIDRESTAFLYEKVNSALSAYESAVFEMYLSDMSCTAMSVHLGKPVKSVENAVHRIRTKLKRLLKS